MRFLYGLLSRLLQIGLGQLNQIQAEGSVSIKSEDKKKEFCNLDAREKELLVSKLLKLLDIQLEVISLNVANRF